LIRTALHCSAEGTCGRTYSVVVFLRTLDKRVMKVIIPTIGESIPLCREGEIMRRLALYGFAGILVVSSLGMTGCCDKEKKEIAALQTQYNELSAKNKELQAKLAQAKAREMGLESQLAQAGTKDAELAEKNSEIARLQAEVARQSSLAGESGSQVWDVGKFADKISVGSDILFASGRATLTSGGKAALAKIVADLKGTYTGLPVRVYGYTDSDPIKRTKNLWQDNLDLSANRAMAVTRYLVNKGIEAETVETVAMGATHFVAKNSSSADKAKNRRVEIVAIKK